MTQIETERGWQWAPSNALSLSPRDDQDSAVSQDRPTRVGSSWFFFCVASERKDTALSCAEMSGNWRACVLHPVVKSIHQFSARDRNGFAQRSHIESSFFTFAPTDMRFILIWQIFQLWMREHRETLEDENANFNKLQRARKEESTSSLIRKNPLLRFASKESGVLATWFAKWNVFFLLRHWPSKLHGVVLLKKHVRNVSKAATRMRLLAPLSLKKTNTGEHGLVHWWNGQHSGLASASVFKAANSGRKSLRWAKYSI